MMGAERIAILWAVLYNNFSSQGSIGSGYIYWMGHELSCMCFRVLVYIQNEQDEQRDHFIICKTELEITI